MTQLCSDLEAVARTARDADLRSRLALESQRGGPGPQDLAADYAAQRRADTPPPETQQAVARNTMLRQLNDIGSMTYGAHHALTFLYEKVRRLYESLGVEWGEEMKPPPPYETLSL